RPTISLSSCYKRENRSRNRSLGPRCRTPASGSYGAGKSYPLGELNPCFQVENLTSSPLDEGGGPREPVIYKALMGVATIPARTCSRGGRRHPRSSTRCF